MDGLGVPIGRRPSVDLIRVGQTEITQLRQKVSGVLAVLLSSEDGFELAATYHNEVLDGGKLAAVSSSILSLVAAFMSEIHLVGCQSMTLDAENGRALIVSVPGEHHPMVMVVIARPDALLGSLIHHIKATVQALIQADKRI